MPHQKRDKSTIKFHIIAGLVISFVYFQWGVLYTTFPMILWIVALLNVAVLACNALSSASPEIVPSTARQVISQKKNGQQVIFSLEDPYDKSTAGGISYKWSTLQQRMKSITTFSSIKYALQSTFLPSVDSGTDINGYMKYMLYVNLQDLSTSLRSVLAKQRILEAVGVGRPGATALSATLSFLSRDFCGTVSSLLFTSFAATSFRRDIKKWKFFSVIMLDIGISCQMVASSLDSQWFLPLLCLGSICEALHNVASGPCAGVIKLHWAVQLLGREDGLAEITAKGRAQRTLVNLVGFAMANILVRWLDSVKSKMWLVTLYLGLSIVQLISSKKSLQLVSLNWLNEWRLRQIVRQFLDSVDAMGSKEGKNHIQDDICVSTPAELSQVESVLFLRSRVGNRHCHVIRMGVSFNKFAQVSVEPLSTLLLNLNKQRKQSRNTYLLTAGAMDGTTVAVAYLKNTTNRCITKAYLHGFILRRILALDTINKDNTSEVILKEARDVAENKLRAVWPLFEACVSKAGWNLEKTELTEGYEVL